MARAVDLDAARRSFLADGPGPVTRDVVRAEVLASWERSRGHGVDAERIGARFAGHDHGSPVVAAAEDTFGEFFKLAGDLAASLVLVDPDGVIRARRDGHDGLARLLDAALLVPGYRYSEAVVGTTAPTLALHEQGDVAVSGPEHYHSRLSFISGAASLVAGRHDPVVCGAVGVLCHSSDDTMFLLPLARMLAQQVTDRMPDGQRPGSRAILECFSRDCQREGEWVLATDGDWVLTNARARQLDGADLRALTDLALAGLALREFGGKHVDLPSGGCAEAATEGVYLAGELVGGLLTGGPRDRRRPAAVPEAVRRQGSHVAPVTRRDYAQDLRPASAQRRREEARIRANQDLLTPFLRARQEVAASITQRRNHLLIGEPGVGSRRWSGLSSGRPARTGGSCR